MKKCFLLFQVCLCVYSVSTAQASAAASLSDYQWLLGKWERTNNRPGQITYETWTKESDTKFISLGWTMRGKDTVVAEKVTLTIRGNDIYYIADVSDNTAAVSFKVIQRSSHNFVAANPEHDFPKQIAYTKNEGNMMTAVISGDGREIPYQFKKIAD
jgi:hypothetical protein